MTITPPADRQEFFKTENLLGDLLEYYVQSLKIIPKAKKTLGSNVNGFILLLCTKSF